MSGPIAYSSFTVLDLDAARLEAAELERYPTRPESFVRSINALDEPCAQAWFEDWLKDNDIEWTCWTNELHVILAGTAEITYWNPPTWTDTGTVSVGPGAIYLVPLGCRFEVRVTSDEPLRHITVDFPNPGFPT